VTPVWEAAAVSTVSAVSAVVSLPAATRVVVLVEGRSDQAAVETLAARRHLDLAARGVAVVAMGGITRLGHHLAVYGPAARDVALAGLYDAGEERVVRRALARAGLGAGLSRPEVASSGFFVCVDDLEDELIRSLGGDAVEAVIEAAGELAPLRTMQRQPAQRERSRAAQLRRFMGTRSGRKIRYGTLLVDAAVDRKCVPAPLDAVLDRVR
jgi:hypothetical protein